MAWGLGGSWSLWERLFRGWGISEDETDKERQVKFPVFVADSDHDGGRRGGRSPRRGDNVNSATRAGSADRFRLNARDTNNKASSSKYEGRRVLEDVNAYR